MVVFPPEYPLAVGGTRRWIVVVTTTSGTQSPSGAGALRCGGIYFFIATDIAGLVYAEVDAAARALFHVCMCA